MNIESIVKQAFNDAGIALDEREVAYFVAVYPIVRSMVDSLYKVKEARYEMPALCFDPSPGLTGWP